MELTEAIIEMVKNDFGVSILANWAVPERKVIGIPFRKQPIKRMWYAAYNQDKTNVDNIRELITYLKGSMPGIGQK